MLGLIRTTWNISELRQGDARFCTLFNLELEKVTRQYEVDNKGTIYNKSTQLHAYAYRTLLVGLSIHEWKETMKRLIQLHR